MHLPIHHYRLGDTRFSPFAYRFSQWQPLPSLGLEEEGVATVSIKPVIEDKKSPPDLEGKRFLKAHDHKGAGRHVSAIHVAATLYGCDFGGDGRNLLRTAH